MIYHLWQGGCLSINARGQKLYNLEQAVNSLQWGGTICDMDNYYYFVHTYVYTFIIFCKTTHLENILVDWASVESPAEVLSGVESVCPTSFRIHPNVSMMSDTHCICDNFFLNSNYK